MNKVYLALLLITIVIAIIIITLGITIKVTKNIECFTTEEIEDKLKMPSNEVKKDHEKNKNIHNKNKNVLVGDIIFMSKEHKTEDGKKYKPTFTENGCEYLLIKDNQKFNFSGSKYKDFVKKFLDDQEGEYIIHVSSGAIGSASKKSFERTPGNHKNEITFKKIGEDKFVKFKDAKITSDKLLGSTAVVPYFFTRSQSADIETPWIEKPMEIKADVDINSLLPMGKVYLYVCISTISD